MWRIIFKSYFFIYISLFIIGFRSLWDADQQSQYQFLLASQAIQKKKKKYHITLWFGFWDKYHANTMVLFEIP